MPMLSGAELFKKNRDAFPELQNIVFVGDQNSVAKSVGETHQYNQGLNLIAIVLPKPLELPAACTPNNTIIFYCYSDKRTQAVLRTLLTPFKNKGFVVNSLYGHTLFSGPAKRGLIHYEAMFAQVAELSIAGDYLEFGCFEGLTFSIAWSAFSTIRPQMRFFAFDGFRGISGAESAEVFVDGGWYANRQTFDHNMNVVGIDRKRMSVIEGDYKETLSEAAAQDHYGISVASCVHIDCDVYAAAIKALRFAGPLLRQGSKVLFDEFHANDCSDKQGERRALAEFLAENPNIRFERWLDYALGARSFIVHVD